MTEIPSPFDRYTDHVRRDWIDHNDHMNMGYYLVVFDFATDAWFDYLGLTREHRARQKITTFCLEGHITYHREVRASDPLRFTTQLVEFDQKRLHYFHAMYHAEEGYLASTNELMSLHVSRATRRGAPMHEEILAKLTDVKAAHGRLPRPPQVGRIIGLTAKPTTR